MKLIIASHNKGKIAELRTLLAPYFEQITSMAEEGLVVPVEETGITFFENAKIKAEYVMRATGAACIADDSGLCVRSLGGAPGVYSARYAVLDGEEATDSANNEKLLQMLHGATDRSAYFECALVLVRPDMPLIAGNGKVEGKILYEAEGEGGFGYDPLFYSIELKKSFGVATKEEKNTVSHRSRALADLISKLKEEA